MKICYKAQEIAAFAHEQTLFQARMDELKADLCQLRMQQDRYLLYGSRSSRRLTPPMSALIVRVESYMQTQAVLIGGIIVRLTIGKPQEFQPGKLHWCEYTQPPRLGRKNRSASVVHPLVDRRHDIEQVIEQLRGLRELLRNKF